MLVTNDRSAAKEAQPVKVRVNGEVKTVNAESSRQWRCFRHGNHRLDPQRELTC